ncbi:MAG: hypothetical protein ACTSQC_05085 [Candidatus Heimdallarchaeaceae archaeon]
MIIINSIERFKEHLIKKENKPEYIEKAVNITKEFEEFLSQRSKLFINIVCDDFFAFSDFLIAEKRNDELHYGALVAFGLFTKNNELVRWGREVFDGSEVMINLSKRLEVEMSKEFRDEVFGNTGLPPFGINPKEKPNYTKKLINKLVNEVGEEKSEEFLAKGLRDPYTKWRKPDREKFLKSKNIDEFMKMKKEEFIKNLEKHRDDGTLFFTQEINDQVIDYVKNHPLGAEGGIREGNKIKVAKIPHETINYLNETDEKMKAYYYCHCPWLKEAMKDGTADEIPDVFCNCSGGYYKDYWQIVLDEPVKVRVLQSVKMGDPVCQFEVTLPEKVVKGLD